MKVKIKANLEGNLKESEIEILDNLLEKLKGDYTIQTKKRSMWRF